MSDTMTLLELDANAMRIRLRNAVASDGGQQAFSRNRGVSQREVSMAVNGVRPVSRAVARALNYERVVEPRQVKYVRRVARRDDDPAPSPQATSQRLSTHRALARIGRR